MTTAGEVWTLDELLAYYLPIPGIRAADCGNASGGRLREAEAKCEQVRQSVAELRTYAAPTEFKESYAKTVALLAQCEELARPYASPARQSAYMEVIGEMRSHWFAVMLEAAFPELGCSVDQAVETLGLVPEQPPMLRLPERRELLETVLRLLEAGNAAAPTSTVDLSELDFGLSG